MEFLKFVTICDADYDSAAVKADLFISEALRTNASVAVIAHNHPFGPLFPTPGDKETNRMIFDALESAGIALVEHYVVSGDRFVGMMHKLVTAFSTPTFFERFHAVEDKSAKPSWEDSL
jgi:DNA repair protein RadC